MKRKLLPLALIGGAVALLRNSKARARVGQLGGQAVGAVQGLLDRGKSQKADLPVSSYRATPTGDVDSEDQGGSWADDGGGGKDGGQASPKPATSVASSTTGAGSPGSTSGSPATPTPGSPGAGTTGTTTPPTQH